ncbi:MAG: hypothetical protein M3285_04545 [Actinomycetota bacterium]|nr:hypothetical protein [Actinomycetota bacterium]
MPKHWWRLGIIVLVILALGPPAWLVVRISRFRCGGVIPALCFAVLAGYWNQLAGTHVRISVSIEELAGLL